MAELSEVILQSLTLLGAASAAVGVGVVLLRVGRMVERQETTVSRVEAIDKKVGRVLNDQATTTAQLEGMNRELLDHRARIEHLERRRSP